MNVQWNFVNLARGGLLAVRLARWLLCQGGLNAHSHYLQLHIVASQRGGVSSKKTETRQPILRSAVGMTHSLRSDL